MNFRRNKPKEKGIRNSDWRYSGLVKRVFRQSKGYVVPPDGKAKPRVFGLVTDDPWYDWADQYIDGDIDIGYDEWTERKSQKGTN